MTSLAYFSGDDDWCRSLVIGPNPIRRMTVQLFGGSHILLKYSISQEIMSASKSTHGFKGRDSAYRGLGVGLGYFLTPPFTHEAQVTQLTLTSRSAGLKFRSSVAHIPYRAEGWDFLIGRRRLASCHQSLSRLIRINVLGLFRYCL